ncbi:MAG: c-type cytochrome [Inquilinaceae bacterium]
MTGTSRRFLVGAAAVAAVLAVAAAFFRPDGPDSRALAIDPDDPQQVALGKDLYAAQCAACHGANLEGQPNWRQRLPNGRLPGPPHDASGHTWHHPDAQLFAITKYGVEALAPAGYESDMPAFEDALTDDQIAAVLAYIKSRWPQNIRRAQAERNATAR